MDFCDHKTPINTLLCTHMLFRNKTEGGMYKVQCGAFSGRANAEKLGQQLKDAGISTYIKEA
jgi:cell division septation protein DedD